MTPTLLADCVSKSFKGRRILSSASLRAVAGEFRALLGRNGTGKSTLLKIAAGCLTPDNGTVHFAGRVYISPSLSTLAAEGLFYLPDHDLLSRAFTVRHQLEMIEQQFGGDSIEEAAHRMGVAERLDQKPTALAGGEVRRLEVAAMFVRRPRCVLADEPLRGIAPKDAEDLTRAFHDLAATGVAVVVTGHEAPTLLASVDHVTWCMSGTTYELGPPSAARQHERFCQDYLGESPVR